MKIQLAVFDLAGTTVKDDRYVHKVLQDALKKHEVEISLEDANEVMGIPKPVAIQQLLHSNYKGSRIISEQWVHAIHQYFVKKMVEFYLHDPGVMEKDGVSETFEILRQLGLKVYCDTGFDPEITKALINRMGWLDNKLIDGFVSSDGKMQGRPHPDMIFEAMRRAGISSVANVAKIGDTPSDMQQGTAAGCALVIGVTTGAFTALQLKFEPHTHLITNVKEVIPIFKNHAPVNTIANPDLALRTSKE